MKIAAYVIEGNGTFAEDVPAFAALIKGSGAEVVLVPGTSRVKRAMPAAALRAGAEIDTNVVDVAVEVTAQVESRQQLERLNQELEGRVLERTRQVHAQQDLLRRILQQVPAFLATFSGPEHRFSFFNAPYQQALGGRVELGRSVAEVMPEVVAQGFIGLLDQVYTTGQPLVGTATPAQLYDPQRRESRLYYVDLLYQPLFDAQQRVQGILAFLVDVTDRTLARQQAEASQQQVAQLNAELMAANNDLLRSNAQLLRVNQNLDNFVYTASHDLKAPITNIEGLVAALREELALPAAETNAELVLRMVDESVQRFQRTLTYLTDVTHLHNTAPLPVVAVPVRELVAAICLDLQPLLVVSHGQVLVAPDACETVTFAEKHLRSILYNFISNGLKYRHPNRKPEVVVQCRVDATGATVLEVRDNGLGLTPAQQQRVFGMFQRQHDHVEGSGIGLYLVKQVVEAAGGRISLESQAGVGSLFRVVLPQPSTTLPVEMP